MAICSEAKTDYIRAMKKKLERMKYVQFEGIKDNFTPFVSQFVGTDQEYLAYKMIDLLIYYNHKNIKIFVEQLLLELRRKLYVEELIKNKGMSDKEYELKWDEYIKNTVFVPLTDKTLTDSAFHVISQFKHFLSEYRLVESRNISSIENLYNLIEAGIKRVFIIDDFVGSGYQIREKFLVKEFNFDNYRKCMLESFIYEHSNVKFEFFVLTSSNVGKKFVEDYGYKFSCIDLYNEDYNITRYNCFNWSSKEEFELFIEIQKQIIDKYNLEFEHTLNLPILFEHSSPKPSHPIYWNEGELKQWKALRRR